MHGCTGIRVRALLFSMCACVYLVMRVYACLETFLKPSAVETDELNGASTCIYKSAVCSLSVNKNEIEQHTYSFSSHPPPPTPPHQFANGKIVLQYLEDCVCVCSCTHACVIQPMQSICAYAPCVCGYVAALHCLPSESRETQV